MSFAREHAHRRNGLELELLDGDLPKAGIDQFLRQLPPEFVCVTSRGAAMPRLDTIEHLLNHSLFPLLAQPRQVHVAIGEYSRLHGQDCDSAPTSHRPADMLRLAGGWRSFLRASMRA